MHNKQDDLKKTLIRSDYFFSEDPIGVEVEKYLNLIEKL